MSKCKRLDEYEQFLEDVLDLVFEEAFYERGWSCGRFAAEADLSYMTVKNLETRKTKSPRLFTILRMARATGFRVSFIVKEAERISRKKKVA